MLPKSSFLSVSSWKTAARNSWAPSDLMKPSLPPYPPVCFYAVSLALSNIWDDYTTTLKRKILVTMFLEVVAHKLGSSKKKYNAESLALNDQRTE